MAISPKKTFFIALLIVLPLTLLFYTLSQSQEKNRSEMILISSGPFIMGSNTVDEAGLQAELGNKKPFYLDEHPERRLSIPSFFIDRFEVVNQDYARFIAKKKRNPSPYWRGMDYPTGLGLLPVVELNWYEARDYCRSLGKRLPTEEEWEKSGRGPTGNLYAWGNTFDGTKGNVSAGSHGGIMMTGRFSTDRSHYGLFDMTGNVMEWTSSWYKPYPGSDYNSDIFGEQYKVARGDAFGESGHYAMEIFSRLTYRQNVYPEERLAFLGFRCAMDA